MKRVEKGGWAGLGGCTDIVLVWFLAVNFDGNNVSVTFLLHVCVPRLEGEYVLLHC